MKRLLSIICAFTAVARALLGGLVRFVFEDFPKLGQALVTGYIKKFDAKILTCYTHSLFRYNRKLLVLRPPE